MTRFSERRAGPASPQSWCALICATGLTAACQSEVVPQKGVIADNTAVTATSGGETDASAATTTAGVSTTGAGGTTPFEPMPPVDCEGTTTLAAPKRMVRLTFNQLASSVRSLFGDALADDVMETFEIGDLTDRDFPPLSSPREGSLFIDSVWQSSDAIAQQVGQYVFDNFESVTGCTAPATLECGKAYVGSLAERAFRRPLDERELTRLLQVLDEAIAAGGSVQEATQYGSYAVMQSPHYLYRTEFGTDVTREETLTPYELASQLAFFITDGPPDQELLDAAESGVLATPDELRAQADRLLLTAAARENLQAAVFAYFELPALFSVVIDPAVAPTFTDGLRSSMYRETELFINHHLWNGGLNDLLLSRTTFVNQSLATLYDVAYPPAGSTPDADGFAQVELDENRSGLLSNAGFLTARSRPDVPSVVGRGILVNATILCAEVPVFPEDLADAIEEATAALEGASEREKADVRMSTPPCFTCHLGIDPYGLALDNFDVIGAYRTTDPQGRPISAAVTLPDGTMTNTLPELANVVSLNGQFATCMAKHLIDYSLAEVSTDLPADSCAVKAVMDRFNTTPQTFSDLIREIAASSTMAARLAGAAP
ncbi:MAG TPA: DUF1592 domain-containing protein [Polyangiaceae bacterium]|nr:DUF1592 domain-containing protein [Polyangiaceae bacterium]